MAFNKMNVEPTSKLQLQIVRFFTWYYQKWKAKNCLPEENINSATRESFLYFSFRILSFKLPQSWIAYVFHPREKQKRCYNKMNLNFAYCQKLMEGIKFYWFWTGDCTKALEASTVFFFSTFDKEHVSEYES